MHKIPIELRFWRKVIKTEGCWVWQGSKDKRNGYGFIGNGMGGLIKVHRLSYFLAYGEFDSKFHVLHTCDNPPCVNPNHLFLGTHADNMRDMIKKGRKIAPFTKGSRNGSSKLTEEDILEIRGLLGKGVLQKVIANKFDVHHSTISAINRHRIWNHI